MPVKKVIAILILMCSSVISHAGEPFFCCSKGSVLHYLRTRAGSEKVEYYHTMTIKDVVSMDGGYDISYSSDFKKDSGGQMYAGAVSLSARISHNGDTEMNVASSLLSVMSNYVSTDKIKAEGGRSVLPSELNPGMTLDDIHAQIKVSVFKYTVDVTERKVLRKETITTPAGTFDCVVVQEHKVEKAAGRTRDTVSQSWYVRAMGYVRHDTYDAKNMTLLTTEVLQKITPAS